ncbi:tetratricopeptide repeat protein [Lamprobacter modestohalophilus]|nr:tetratricopeptide repeat protein [Lamprobacter modestohalophilus]
MSKKTPKNKPKRSSKRKTSPHLRPEPAQLRAIERLLEAEDFAKAIERVQQLVQRFPDHGGAQGLLIKALRGGQGSQFAAVVVHDWADRHPQSLFAQEQLLVYAVEGHCLMLAERVAEQVRALGGEAPYGFPLSDEIKTALCTLVDGTRADEAAMVQFDRARLCMNGFAFSKALRYLEDLELTSARNNRITCLFHLERIDEALALALESWRRDDENLFALGWAASLRLYLGDVEGASGLCTRLAMMTARRVDEALPQLIALLLLDQPEAAWTAYERTVDTPWWEGVQDLTTATMTHLGACAAARCGELKQARRLWQEIEQASPGFALAAENRLAAADAETLLPSALEMHNAIPASRFSAMRNQVQAQRTHQAEKTLIGLSASNAYLRALYINGSEPLRQAVSLVLMHRLQQHDTAVAEVLRELVRLPIGTSNDRFKMLKALREAGQLGEDELIEFWDRDELRAIKLFEMEVHREPTDSGLLEALDSLLDEARDDYNDFQFNACESKLQSILASFPNHPQTLLMLASIRHMARRRTEAEQLLRQAIEANPDYLLARCNLARALIMRGDLEAASDLLEGHREQHRIHILDLIHLNGTLAMLESARGEDEVAESQLNLIESFIEDDHEAEQLEQVRRLVNHVKAKREGFFGRTLRALARR